MNMTTTELAQTRLSQHHIFSSLSSGELAELSELIELVHLESGETVFSAGEESLNLYLVVTGEISVLKIEDYGTSREIAKIIAGDCIGEIDMISLNNRNATAIAAAPSDLVRFPRSSLSFTQFLDEHPLIGSKILYAFIADIAERTRHANHLLKENSPHIQELRRQMYEDKLTHTFNRTYLEENLPGWLDAHAKPVSLLMIKPDNFKEVNDQAGHEAGDKLLEYLAQLLPSVIPPNALLIRFLGNEFALVLKSTGAEEARTAAEKIRSFYNSLDITRFLPVSGFQLTVSIGIAVYPDDAADARDLIEEAHCLPLEGRARGGNKILFPSDRTDKIDGVDGVDGVDRNL